MMMTMIVIDASSWMWIVNWAKQGWERSVGAKKWQKIKVQSSLQSTTVQTTYLLVWDLLDKTITSNVVLIHLISLQQSSVLYKCWSGDILGANQVGGTSTYFLLHQGAQQMQLKGTRRDKKMLWNWPEDALASLVYCVYCVYCVYSVWTV